MKLEIIVDVKGQMWVGGAAAEVPELLIEAFEPMHVYDEPIPFIGNYVVEDSNAMKRVVKLRKDAAQILASTLTDRLIF